MTEAPAPLTFTDEQLVAALKISPPEVLNLVQIIAMQTELAERRASDKESE